VLVSAFHPEMSDDSRLHAFFLDHVATRTEGEAGESSSPSEPPHPRRRLQWMSLYPPTPLSITEDDAPQPSSSSELI
jgi:hypothetical protein